jgi:hypothetical protein
VYALQAPNKIFSRKFERGVRHLSLWSPRLCMPSILICMLRASEMWTPGRNECLHRSLMELISCWNCGKYTEEIQSKIKSHNLAQNSESNTKTHNENNLKKKFPSNHCVQIWLDHVLSLKLINEKVHVHFSNNNWIHKVILNLRLDRNKLWQRLICYCIKYQKHM